MIRIALIVIGFLAITVVLIIKQPSAPRLETMAEPVGSSAVTRADTDLESLADVALQVASGQDKPDPHASDPQPDLSQETPQAAEPRIDAAHAPQTELETMIVTALRQGQSDAYIDALVNDASQKGKVDVPGSLVTADGRVDTSTLLKVLSASPDVLRAGGHVYNVQPGDSLASISFRFYGTTARSQDIFEANRETLAASGQIQVGQELVIPAN